MPRKAVARIKSISHTGGRRSAWRPGASNLLTMVGTVAPCRINRPSRGNGRHTRGRRRAAQPRPAAAYGVWAVARPMHWYKPARTLEDVMNSERTWCVPGRAVKEAFQMMSQKKRVCALVGMTLLWTGAVLGADTQKNIPPNPSPEIRQKMAEVHQRMAVCLKSDKPMTECRAEMLKNCQDLMGRDGCPMMESWSGGMGPGMMSGGMMPGQGMMQEGSTKKESDK